MKISIVTFHRANNFGAVLQAYALNKYIEQLGIDCEILDYENQFLEQSYNPFYIRKFNFRSLARGLIYFPIKFARQKVYSRFRETYLNTGEMYTAANVDDANLNNDAFIFGSDQIWNETLTEKDLNYLGKFVTKDSSLFAYAASFGKSTLPVSICDEYRSLLSRYQMASMREKSGQLLYEEITQKESLIVMDPVFLLNRDNWSSLCLSKTQKGKYILVYHLQGERTNVMDCAQFLSNKTQMPIVELQAWVKKRPQNVIPRYADSPNDFLGWIRDAEYIVTDSFHCAAFSIIFGKKFWSKIDAKKNVPDTRVGNLLYNLSLQDRIIPQNMEEWKYYKEINFDYTYNLMEGQIINSIEFLNELLNCVRGISQE